ncbi:MAG: redoxin domain-containing protein [Salinibacter sp.]
MSNTNSRQSPTAGDAAPNFTLYTHDERRWQLSDHQDRPVVLLFFPGAFTSVCTNELHRANTEIDVTDQAHVVGISTDSPFALSAFREEEGYEFPLLSDHNAEVAAMYGSKYAQDFAGMNLDRIAKRSAFVIDQEGVIRYAEVLDNAGHQPDFAAIQNTIQELL